MVAKKFNNYRLDLPVKLDGLKKDKILFNMIMLLRGDDLYKQGVCLLIGNKLSNLFALIAASKTKIYQDLLQLKICQTQCGHLCTKRDELQEIIEEVPV